MAAQSSSIEWTDSTWNPVTGCTRISPGCVHCYAERLAKRLHAMGNPRYTNGFKVTLHEDLVELPLSWRTPKMIFVNSMSDLFHVDVPLEFIQRCFRTMAKADWHVFQILTKRADRVAELAPKLEWPENVWMGVSVENERYLPRIDYLRQVPAFVRFLSLEPLIGPLPGLNLDEIHWVIAGGESGPGARPVKAEWIRAIRDRCQSDNVPFFFKQWGGVWKKRTGRELDGRTWDQLPASWARSLEPEPALALA